MQTKRDQVQAHSFVVSRLRSALLTGDADAMETPTRRFSVSAVSGIVVAALIVGACAAFGFFFPGGSTAWREPGTIIVEKETGITYVYDRSADVLHPALNHTSAKLLTGPDSTVRTVSAKSLRDTRHGLAVGIVGAPDALPQEFTNASWLACATTTSGNSGQQVPGLTLMIGLGETKPLAEGVVVAVGNERYLLWNGHRLNVADAAAFVALGLDQARPVTVLPAWLNALPVGPDLRPPDVPGRGQPGPTIAGQATHVGQILRVSGVDGPTTDYRLVLADGLASLTPTMAALITADPRGGTAVLDVASSSVVTAPRSPTVVDIEGLPARPPTLLEPATLGRRSLCARDGSELVSVAVPAVPALPAEMVSTRTATHVAIRPGSGVLVQGPGNTRWLVTDVGLRHPLSPEAVVALGYESVVAVEVPSTLLSLVPTGPRLDPALAAAQVWDGP